MRGRIKLGAKEVREALQVEFNARPESMAKADLEAVNKSKQSVLASKTAELTLLLNFTFLNFKSSVDKATKNTSIDEWTSMKSLRTLKDCILDNFKSYLTVRRFSENLPHLKDKGQSDTTQRSNTDRPMETDASVTSLTLRNYLDNYVLEKKVVCQHNNRKGQAKQPRGRSRTRNTVGRSRKQSIPQNRKPNPSPRNHSVSCQIVRSSLRASVSFVSKNYQKKKVKVADKETEILC